MRNVRIIGAGFSGLTLAYELSKREVPVEIFEKGAVGGMIHSGRATHGVFESAANGFLCNPDIENLTRELNLKMISPMASAKHRYIFRSGKVRRWPISWNSSWNLGKGFLQRILGAKRLLPKPQETVEQFTLRCFNREILDYLVVPGLQGIYGPDVRSLSASLVFGRAQGDFVGTKRKGHRGGLVSLVGGMGELTKSLADGLAAKGIHVQKSEIKSKREAEADGSHVVVATPLSTAVELLDLQEWKLDMNSLVSSTCWFPESDRLPKGFGCLFPETERPMALGVLFNSHIFPGRAGNGVRSETWILDGERFLDKDSNEVASEISRERQLRFKIYQTPIEHCVHNWPRALPRYNVQLESFLEKEKDLLSMHAHGNYLGGIGLAKIYRRSIKLADRLKEHLR